MKHREVLKTQAIENGESVEDWDKIVLSGAKIKQTTSSESVKEESWGGSNHIHGKEREGEK